MNKLMVRRELFDKFKELFTVIEPDVVYLHQNLETRPMLIPKRWFGESGNIIIHMQVKFDKDWKSQAILVEKPVYEEMLSYFEAYDHNGDFDVPMLRKVFEFPAEHVPRTDGSFRLVCHLRPDDAVDEPKLKQEGSKGGYVIDL